MNCLNCDAENTRDYPFCRDCEDSCHFTDRADCRCKNCKWIDYREAAKLMRRPRQYLRYRWANGEYKYWPAIERWQPGGRRTRLYVRRADVERWIEASRTPAPPAKQPDAMRGYESALQTARRLGAIGTMRSFGLLK